jgi:hypothetical protein
MAIALVALVTSACSSSSVGPDSREVDEAATSVDPNQYRVEVKEQLRKGCSSQTLTSDEVRYCEDCRAKSTADTTCECSIVCSATAGVIKMCGCSTFAPPTR